MDSIPCRVVVLFRPERSTLIYTYIPPTWKPKILRPSFNERDVGLGVEGCGASAGEATLARPGRVPTFKLVALVSIFPTY